ncbi:MAG: porphobilinogen synthase, partial [Candidatus Omnitrophica bacterium]|nr:porphobilinogen synthase [Candidatus Omnitrophota bacterium]
MSCPVFRLRRLRKNNGIRQMIRETHLSRNDLIMPFFVVPGRKIRQAVKSMPGVMRFSIDNLIKEVKEVDCLGIPAMLLFGIPQRKDKKAAEAYKEKGVVQQAIRCIKKEFPEMVVITDVCLCSYTSHGHCGIVKDGKVDNDETIKLLAKTALS